MSGTPIPGQALFEGSVPVLKIEMGAAYAVGSRRMVTLHIASAARRMRGTMRGVMRSLRIEEIDWWNVLSGIPSHDGRG